LAGVQGERERGSHVADVEVAADDAAVAVVGDLRRVAAGDGEEFGDQAGGVAVGTAGEDAGAAAGQPSSV
jgi:hypothetical protein